MHGTNAAAMKAALISRLDHVRRRMADPAGDRRAGVPADKQAVLAHRPPAERLLLVAYPALLASAYLIRDHDLLRHVFFGLALAAVAFVLKAEDYRAVLRSSVGSLALLYLGYFGLSVLWSEPRAIGVPEMALRGLAIAAFLVLTVTLSQRDPEFVRRLMLAIVEVGALAALAAMLWFYAHHEFPNDRVEDFGIGGYFTRAGTMYGVAAVGAWWLLGRERRTPARRFALAVSFAVLLAFVALAQARGAMLGLALAGLTWALVTRQRTLLALGFAVVIAGIGLDYFDLLGAYDLLSRGFTLRLHTWTDAIARMPDALWFGYGVADPQTFILKYGKTVIHPHTIPHPHNIFLAHQLHGGLVGAAIFLALITAVGWVGWRAWYERHDFLILTLLAFLVGNGLVDFGHFYSQLDLEWFLFWLPTAIAAGTEVRLKALPPLRLTAERHPSGAASDAHRPGVPD
jgi:O-antigen ligase